MRKNILPWQPVGRQAAIVMIICLLAACGNDLKGYNLADAERTGLEYSFAIWQIDLPDELPAEGLVTVPVTLINTGTQAWTSTDERPYFLSYHWKHPGGRFTSDMFWGERTALPAIVGTGEMVELEMAIATPALAKHYDITIDIVRGRGRDRETVDWFEELGWETYNLRREVVAQ